ncbi:MAG: hypothetical protein ETSY1_07805 [Candidatus Entotheonella factor]|uniref:Uncharacterized protein n=1 Tax=Entotheonella factor TaxID=1429438 RepID=W4LUE9_ENTF1|nr:MAG: hypothetical protein ETSY1_07805 [Candidatus Entotheonella factor]
MAPKTIPAIIPAGLFQIAFHIVDISSFAGVKWMVEDAPLGSSTSWHSSLMEASGL